MNFDLGPSVRFRGRRALADAIAELPAADLAVCLPRVVVDSVAAQGGLFLPIGALGSVSLHVLQRHLLAGWQRAGWVAPGKIAPGTLDAAQGVLEQILALRRTHPSLELSKDEYLWRRIVTRFWFIAVEQGFDQRAMKMELARAWIMYEKIWPALVEQKITHVLTADSAFNSLRYHLFLTGLLWSHKGFVPNARAALVNTTLHGEGVTAFLENYAMDADEFLGTSDSVDSYPRALRNPFLRVPVLRVGTGLLAPDPITLFMGAEYRVLQQALGDAMISFKNPQAGFEAASEAFGAVFEEYVRRLIAAVPDDTRGGPYRAEYRYDRAGKAVNTPDAFILGAAPVVFECKALRYPFDSIKGLTLDGFVAWVDKLGGATDKRGPLDQGASFLEDVALGRVPNFSQADADRAIYVIVSYETVPFTANRLDLRREFWAGRLSGPAQALCARTAIVSVRDLEVAASVAEAESVAGRPFDLARSIHAWWADVNAGPLMDGSGNLKEPLGAYLLRRHPPGSHALRLLQTQWDEFFDEATKAGFGFSP